MVKSDYLHGVFNPKIFPDVIEKVKNIVKDIDYDAIAFRGISGSAVAFPLSLETGKSLLCVRKCGSSHSAFLVEGVYGIDRYIIIDDLIYTGGTLREIKEQIHNNHYKNKFKVPECAGIIFYYEFFPDKAEERAHRIYPGVKVHVIDRYEYEEEEE